MKKRANSRMVDEDDPQFVRFWSVYPVRVSKKDARKAWMDLAPSPELVDRMLAALGWQAALWARQGYGTPYPASWLRAERWTDEPPRAATAQPAYLATCGHTPKCGSLRQCIERNQAERVTV